MVARPRFLLLAALFGACYFLCPEAAPPCWRRPYCYCNQGERPSIYCRFVRNVSDVVPLLRSRSPVYKIGLHGSFRTLPASGTFDGISVVQLTLTAPLGPDLPVGSLLGVRDLRTLALNRTTFEGIPSGALLSSDLRDQLWSFQSVGGSLTGLASQLQNLSQCSELVLARNRIRTVSGDAFRGSGKLQRLDLSRNEIEELLPDTFRPIPFLEEVDLRLNRLHTVDGCFSKVNPKIINLYGNSLASVDGVFHGGMWNLRYLDLGGNPGLNVTSHTFGDPLKSLTELHLSGNGIDHLDSSLLRNLWNLHYLYLNGNNLSSVPRYFLEHTKFITTLELSDNRLESADSLLVGVGQWYNSLKVTLDGNRLTNASVGRESRVTIHSIDFSRNRIGSIRAEDMKRLNTAVYLNLSRNDIDFLEKECFSGFQSLQNLDLSYNPLTNLNQTLRDLNKLYSLHISSCLLETLTEEDFLGCQKIKYLHLRNNSLSDVYGAFRNMKYINVLDVSSNNLTTLTTDSFPPFQKISIRVRELYMANNSWSCDCRLTWFADWVRRKGSKLSDEPICSSPAHLQGLPMRTLNRTDFESWEEDCPETCECLCRAEGQQMYTEVMCHHKGLKEVPKVLPSNVRSLDLSGNIIESFDGQDVPWLEELDQLNLENNKIKEIQLVLPPKLSSLRLAYNRLHTFPIDKWVSNVSMTLSQNPWACNCDTWAFRNWLIQHNDSIIDLHEVRCGSEESFSLRNRPISLLTRKDLCSYLSSIIIISGCSVLLLILCLICFCCRQSLVAWLYFWGCRCLKRYQRHVYPYDAFLLYSEDDENLALGEIAKGLESGRHTFLLCILTRDIPSPRTTQKVTAYLPQCTKVIVLLTRKFIENRECMQLLISAASFSTESSSQCIIFITQGDLPTDELDPAIKTLLRSCTRLQWGQCLFWQKLIYNLPKKQSKNQTYDDIEEEPLMQ